MSLRPGLAARSRPSGATLRRLLSAPPPLSARILDQARLLHPVCLCVSVRVSVRVCWCNLWIDGGSLLLSARWFVLLELHFHRRMPRGAGAVFLHG